MKNRNDRERENSLSHDSAKRFYFAKQRQTKKKYRVTQPLKQPQRNNDNSLEAVLGSLTGGHSDNQKSSYERHTEKAVSITPADKLEEAARQRQMQKAVYLRERLSQENNDSDSQSIDIRDRNNEYSDNDYPRDDYYSDNSEQIADTSAKNDKMTITVSSKENKDRRTDTEKRYYDERPAMSDDPAAAERFYKAKFIKENLERDSSVSAFMAYKFSDESDRSAEIPVSKEDTYYADRTDAVERSVNDVIQVGAIPALSDDVKDNIVRLIKQKHLAQRIEDRRDRYAAEDVKSHDFEKQNKRQDYSDDVISEYERYGFEQKMSDDVRKEIVDTSPISSTEIVNREIVTEPQDYPVQHKTEIGVNAHVDNAVSHFYGIKQAADSTDKSDSAQAVPYNLGMILAQNEGKKIAYQLAKGEDVLAEKERSHVAERMSQSRFRFVDSESHKPKVEPRETIREEQKRKFIKNTEMKLADVRREAEQKVKENIFIKANRKDTGGIIKVVFGEKIYSPKSKGVVIAGAVGAVIPVILIIIVMMFICGLFSWLSPHSEKLFDKDSKSYKTVELDGVDVVTGYVDVVRDIYDEKQLEVLAFITQLESDSGSLDNKYIKLEECFDIESIIAIEAAKKWREIQDSEEDSETAEDSEDIVYHLTREDFEEVIKLTYTLDFRVQADISPDVPEDGSEPEIVRTLTGSGVINYASLAESEDTKYYFFDVIFDKDSETYEEDKMMYDLYKEILQKHLLGTSEEPSHTIVDYENNSEDWERMCECAEAKGYYMSGDKVYMLED